MKKRGYSLIVLMAIAQTVQADSQRSTDHHRLEIFYQRTALYEFQKVSLSVREVPRHPDDGYLNEGADSAIVQDHVGFRIWIFGIRYTLGLPLKVVTLRIGPTLYVARGERLHPPVDPEERHRLYARYRAGGNGYKYYEVEPRTPTAATRVLFGITIPRESKFEESKLHLTGGVELDPLGLPIYAESGWDRFNRDEVWKTFSIGKIREHSAFLRLELGDQESYQNMYLFLEAGYLWGSFSPKKNFSQMTAKMRTPFRIGLGAGFTL